MKVLFDITHPAHIHFFKQPIRLLKERGHQVVITSREKEFALELIDELGLVHHPLSSLGKGGIASLAGEMVTHPQFKV